MASKKSSALVFGVRNSANFDTLAFVLPDVGIDVLESDAAGNKKEQS
jgi:hypothetical protein